MIELKNPRLTIDGKEVKYKPANIDFELGGKEMNKCEFKIGDLVKNEFGIGFVQDIYHGNDSFDVHVDFIWNNQGKLVINQFDGITGIYDFGRGLTKIRPKSNNIEEMFEEIEDD